MGVVVVIAVALVVLAVAVNGQEDAVVAIPILKSERVMNDDGSYAFSYESADGISRTETGEQKQIGDKPEDSGSTAQGTISRKAPNGKTVTMTFTADENGYQPKVTVS